ncbi:PEP-CTERM sorting domain-containing protein [Singulisphaera sp. PoT]|uniref:PEP-CTERM sorting domain-containing protein n=1 Tax=Singulisphaera sp. PoT TaxID=3411797 RepID=UPI003BF54658
MHWPLLTTLVSLLLIAGGQIAESSAISLLNYEGGLALSQSAPENSGFFIPMYLPMTLDYGPQGGSITFNAGAFTPPFTGLDAYSDQTFPISGQFFFNLGVPANGSNDSFAGPVLDISGSLSGSVDGPGSGGTTWRWSGKYGGTATSAMIDVFSPQDASLLPAPLQDILNHPDHFHFAAVVTGGWQNELQVTLTFDAPTPVPEPTTLITLAAGVAGLIYRRRNRR